MGAIGVSGCDDEITIDGSALTYRIDGERSEMWLASNADRDAVFSEAWDECQYYVSGIARITIVASLGGWSEVAVFVLADGEFRQDLEASKQRFS